MNWEKLLIVLCAAFVVGIAFSYAFIEVAPVLLIAIALFSIVLITAIVLGFLQHRKYHYFSKKYLNFILISIGFIIAILNFQFQNRIPENHLSGFGEFKPKDSVTIEGVVVDEPTIQRDKVTIRVKPYLLIQDNKEIKINGKGKVQVYIYPGNQYYGKIYFYDKVRITGQLVNPRPAENPGGFNYAKFLRASNIYSQMFIRDPGAILKLGTEKGNPIIKLALKLKENMLVTIRKTIPYPESAFLGGVTLGLRYGIRKMYLEGSETLIEEEFKHSGVNHVLAVSGLHVTIITVMFWGIFAMFKLPRKVFPFIIIFFLLLFTIITGGRPSTIRAAIMNSLILATYALTKSGLRASIMTGIAAAAALILMFTPRVVVEASFTLSFGAVLSLVLLTPPVMEILNTKLVGYRFIAGIVITVLFTAMIIILQNSFFTILWFIVFLTAAAGIWVVGEKIQKSNPMLGFSFRRIPGWLGGFIGAQFAIQLGMMIPLSAFYFGRYPIAGAYANFLAIPLIGVNVQLGILAGVFGLIPKIGLSVALLLNAGNYLFCKFFLWLAHVATLIFPYPHVIKPSGPAIAIYYLLIAGFIWKDFVIGNLKKYYFNIVVSFRNYPKRSRKILISVIASVVVVIFISVFFIKPQTPRLKVLFFSVGRSNAVFIQTPLKKRILIDAGLHYKYMKDGIPQEWDVAEKTIIPTLLKMNIKTIDYLVVTNLNKENTSGVHTIIKNMNVKNVLLPLDKEKFHADLSYDEFLELIKNDYYVKNKEKWWVMDYYDQYISLLKLIREKQIPSRTLKYGEFIVHEFHRSGKMIKELEIYCLNPKDSEFTGARDELSNKSIIINVVYGVKPNKETKEYLKKKSFLLLSDVGKDIQLELVTKGVITETDVITVPYKGEKKAICLELLHAAKPLDAVLQFDSRGRNRNKEEDLKDFLFPEYKKLKINIFRTDEVGAVIYTTNGVKLKRKVMVTVD
ncbi:ComEC/Rec2 family competence protein [Candidatus Dependentiae bacterium]|nr:ComEC/Rec2 family competence protein [Candidatus Dependentiae bacterium]